MSDTLVQYEVEGRAARLTLDSPHNRNALSSGLVRQLREGLQRAAADQTVRAVVLTHTGNTFCAGADLSEASEGSPQDIAKDRAGQLTALLRDILELPLPVIIAVNGHVRAGGFGLVGAADIAVAGPDSTFALTEARIGVAPSIISLTLLPRLTSRSRDATSSPARSSTRGWPRRSVWSPSPSTAPRLSRPRSPRWWTTSRWVHHRDWPSRSGSPLRRSSPISTRVQSS